MAKTKRAVSVTESTFEDLRLLVWARRQQGDSSISVSGILDDLAKKYVAEHQEEIDFLKAEMDEMARRRADFFSKKTTEE